MQLADSDTNLCLKRQGCVQGKLLEGRGWWREKRQHEWKRSGREVVNWAWLSEARELKVDLSLLLDRKQDQLNTLNTDERQKIIKGPLEFRVHALWDLYHWGPAFLAGVLTRLWWKPHSIVVSKGGVTPTKPKLADLPVTNHTWGLFNWHTGADSNKISCVSSAGLLLPVSPS